MPLFTSAADALMSLTEKRDVLSGNSLSFDDKPSGSRKCDSSESTLIEILQSQICILQKMNSFITNNY